MEARGMCELERVKVVLLRLPLTIHSSLQLGRVWPLVETWFGALPYFIETRSILMLRVCMFIIIRLGFLFT